MRLVILRSPATIFRSLAGLAMCTLAVEVPALAANAPSIQFAATVHDFGTVTVGQVIKHEFAFANTGTDTLVISEVRTTCGCASIGTGSRRVAPGQGGTLPVEFHTGAFDGPVAKTLTVVCNDPGRTNVVLEMKGVVWHPMVATPPNAAFVGTLDSPLSLVKSIVITNRDATPLTFSAVTTSHRAISAALKTNKLGQEYELTVRLVPPLGSGNLFGDVKLNTSSAAMPVLNIPVWIVAQPPVLVLPPELTLPTSLPTNGLVHTVSIRNNSTDPLSLSQARIDAEGVQLETSELQAGKHFAVQLKFPPGFQQGSSKTLTLTLETNNPKVPQIKVPIVRK